MPNNVDLYAPRERWIGERRLMGLSDPQSPGFALSGLGSSTPNLDVRLAILPADPQADPVNLDHELIEWLQKPREGLYRDVFGYGQTRTTSSAAIIHDRTEQQHWEWFVGIHRHGGVEAAHSSMARVSEQQKFFFLRQIVSLAWNCLEMQMEATQKWTLHGPLEMSLGLRGTEGAALTDFAEGWEPAFSIYRNSTPCLEPNVLLRWEFHDDFDPEKLALEVGARIENAFGSVERRFLARRGEYEGRFDPS